MNDIFAKAERFSPMALSLLRFVAGLLFLEHGLSKLAGWPQSGHSPEFLTLLWFAGCIEAIGGALVTVGLFTRIAAIIMSGEMAFAYFMAHNPRGVFPIINLGDAAILFCFVFLYIACAGPGPWSLDAMMGKKQ
jgi:putative oxidoreductase